MSFIVHTGDAATVLSSLEPESVDCVVTDPPYAETSLAWDRAVVGWLALCRPLLKPTGSVWFFTSLKHLLTIDLHGWRLAQEIVWEKHNGSSFHNDRFRRVHELAVQLYPANRPWGGVFRSVILRGDGKERIVRRSRGPDHHDAKGAGTFLSAIGGRRMERSVIKVNSCHGKAVHPTQKPVGIVAPLVLYSCPEGGVVLDPFTGSGTTGEVAIMHGRSFVGIELNPTYAALARDRCDNAHRAGRQLKIQGVA